MTTLICSILFYKKKGFPLNYNFNTNLKNLNQKLKSNIFGQDHIIDEVTDILKINYSGLGDDKKPIGSFLFVGSTGVGKTELAIQLSKELNLHFKRFDMSEFSDRHSVKNFIGGDAGLVGHEDGGLLTNHIKNHSKSLILFDEIEKSHNDVMNIFLQILDYGHLTSTKGEEVSFKDTIIIFTSNLSSGYETRKTMGFHSTMITEKSYDDNNIDSFLTPELKARIDSILIFNSLNEKMISSIVDKNIKELDRKLKKLNVNISLTNSLKEYIVKNIFEQNLGARSISKIIRDKIKTKIANEILNENIVQYTNIVFSLDETTNEFILEITNKPDNKKSLLDIGEYPFFYDVIEAQEYAKANLNIAIVKSPCGRGYVVKELEIINGVCV